MLTEGKFCRLGDLEVHRVMGRRDFHRACAERGINSFIGDDGNLPAYSGQDSLLAQQACISLIFGIDRHCGIAEDGLGTGGSYGDILVFPSSRR